MSPAGTSIQSQKHKDTATQDPLIALDNVIEHIEPALYVFKDFHHFLKPNNISVIRRLREVSATMQNTYKTIVIVSPTFELPPELEKDLTVVDFDLPGGNDFAALLSRIIEEVKDNPKLNVKMDTKTRERIVHALFGLTLTEAENVLAKTLVEHRCLGEKSLNVIHSEKKQIIRKSGLLEYYDAEGDLASVGGLDALKNWLLKRSAGFTDQARQFGLPPPKGVLLLGVQGCGKELNGQDNKQHMATAAACDSTLARFSARLSVRRSRTSAGQSRSRNPLRRLCSGLTKSTRRFAAHAEAAQAPTAAQAHAYSARFLRGYRKKISRFSLSPLPTTFRCCRRSCCERDDSTRFSSWICRRSPERKAIFEIHLKKRKIDPALFDIDALASASAGYSGAEIEEAVISAMFDMFYEKQNMTTERLLESIRQTVPLSKTMSEDIDALRKWAEGGPGRQHSPEAAKQDARQTKT